MSEIFLRLFVILIALLQSLVSSREFNDTLLGVGRSNDKTLTISRRKRVLPPPPLAPSLLFPYNAATGLLAAIAVPVALNEYNVFVSYNFEANYNMANQPFESVPGPIKRLKLNEPYPSVDPNGDASYNDVIARNIKKTDEDTVDTDNDEYEATTLVPDDEDEIKHEIMKRSPIFKTIFTRVGIYTMLESRLDADGVNGKKCLLHAICESSKISFLQGNGVLGHIFHIILTPSSSFREKELPSEYYKAEFLGLKGDCSKYEKTCNVNVLSLFSTII